MKEKLAILLATWFYSGFLKPAPGTWGTLAALPFGIALMSTGTPFVLLLAIAILFPIGLWSAKHFDTVSEAHDSKEIVIDEVIGMWIALIPASLNPLSILAAFILFRGFDILKPWPISIIDKRIKGSWGVMLDDVVAGIFAALILLGASYVLPIH